MQIKLLRTDICAPFVHFERTGRGGAFYGCEVGGEDVAYDV